MLKVCSFYYNHLCTSYRKKEMSKLKMSYSRQRFENILVHFYQSLQTADAFMHNFE